MQAQLSARRNQVHPFLLALVMAAMLLIGAGGGYLAKAPVTGPARIIVVDQGQTDPAADACIRSLAHKAC